MSRVILGISELRDTVPSSAPPNLQPGHDSYETGRGGLIGELERVMLVLIHRR